MERGGSSNNKGMGRSAVKIRGRSPSWNRQFDPTPAVNERTEATAGRKKAKKKEGENPTQGCKKRGGGGDDQCIPMGSVTRIMRRVLPEQAKVSDDAKEAIQQCVTEFISFVTREANTRCRRDYRSTITPDDLVSTMAALGFTDYVEPLTLYLNKHRAQDPMRAAPPPPPAPVARPSPLSPPPAPVLRPSPLPLKPPPAPVVKPSPMPPPLPQMDLFPPSPMPAYVPAPPVAAVDDDCFGELPLMRDYFVDNHGGREFDPFN